MTSVAHLSRTDQLTIPAGIRRAAGLEPGQAFQIAITRDGLLLRAVEPNGIPDDIDPDQAWFWTPEWQAKEREAEEDIATDGLPVSYSLEGFFAALNDE